MDNGLGINFAPTSDPAMNNSRQGAIEGVPQAIKVLSLRLPRVLGAQAPAPAALLNAKGAQGMDPYMSALFRTLATVLSPDLPQMGAEPGGGFAAPGAARPSDPNVDFIQPPGRAPDPGIHFQPQPGGTVALPPRPYEPPPPRRSPFDGEWNRRL